MRTLLVVATDVLPEDSPEMALAEHQDMVQTLSPCRSYEALGKSVRPGWLDRAANDTNALRVKHLIESPRVLGVAVPDQELGFGEAIFNREVAGLLGNLSLIHISEPTRRTPISYAVFCLKKKKKNETSII